MELTTVWFVLIAVLWIGYLVLEGFDFGVGMLTAVLARDEKERRVLLNTIGPVWDGNEVWLIVAGGATFAAFPEWYATLFSGFYLPLFVILVALILRIVALEYRSKRPAMVWKRRCDVGILIGSVVPAVLWGVALANLVRGVPIDADKEFVGSVVDLLNPYALLGGLVTLTVFLVHGAVFVGLKTVGDIRERARVLALRVGVVAAVLATVGPARGLGLRRHGAVDRRGGGHALHGAVPRRHGLLARPVLEPHDDERGVDAVHADDHDLGRGGLHAPGRRLPGVVVLGVPAADRDAPHP